VAAVTRDPFGHEAEQDATTEALIGLVGRLVEAVRRLETKVDRLLEEAPPGVAEGPGEA
jgi:hypothetical protein